MKATTTRKSGVREDYLKLVREFPLRPLRGKADHAGAMQMYARFAGREDLTPGENDYVDALALFIGEYEEREHRIEMMRMSPLRVLEYLLEENGMSTTDLGEVVGSRGLASEIRNGKRGLSRVVIQKLVNRFHVGAELFFRVDN